MCSRFRTCPGQASGPSRFTNKNWLRQPPAVAAHRCRAQQCPAGTHRLRRRLLGRRLRCRFRPRPRRAMFAHRTRGQRPPTGVRRIRRRLLRRFLLGPFSPRLAHSPQRQRCPAGPAVLRSLRRRPGRWQSAAAQAAAPRQGWWPRSSPLWQQCPAGPAGLRSLRRRPSRLQPAAAQVSAQRQGRRPHSRLTIRVNWHHQMQMHHGPVGKAGLGATQRTV